MVNNQSWSTVTGNLYQGVMIQTWCNIAAAIFAIFALFSNIGDLMSGNIFGALEWGFWDYMEILATLGSLYGFYLFFTNLRPWKELVDPMDASTIESIYTATILQIIAVVLSFIPLIGLIGLILQIVAWVLLLMAYSKLKYSTTFPAEAKEGAAKIHKAMLFSLIAAILSIIPVINLLGLVLSIFALYLTLKGWEEISKAEV
ncbi:MAG: hypothetical protein IJB01_02285 [Bacteroidaceae bacterium]|nr:hypothetical protein [Bacteroidaceae bacterium]